MRPWCGILAFAGLLCGVARAVSGSGDTPAGPLDTRAPDFSATEVEPAETLGQDVVVRVRADEPLAYPPMVEINSRPCTLLPSTSFDYTFSLVPGDRFHPGELHVEGADLVGNSASMTRAFDVLAPLPVPQPYCLLAVALLGAGLSALRWRCRGVLPVVLGVMLAASARAEHPTVTNASFLQRAAEVGTEIVITYDLSAPNGPCAISVRLSKDGGLDGYPYAVSSVSGDLSGVGTGTGHSIVWNVGADYPNEDLPSVSLRITADDDQPEFTVQYLAGTGGSISGDATQAVVLHHDAAAVTAVADLNFHFTGWSDGVLTATRNDLDIIGDFSVTANFAANMVEMVAVPAGSFEMGRTSAGDDAAYGSADELPVHAIQLSAYQIGKYEITNQQFCAFLNWAIDPARNYLRTSTNTVWIGSGNVYGGTNLQPLLSYPAPTAHLQFAAGTFSPKTRAGLPAGTNYFMGNCPVVSVTWYGAALFANWLSELEGLIAVYDSNTWMADFTNSGYYLPTEAQWERAAAWDGTRHWTYGCMSDTLTGQKRANYATFYIGNPLSVAGIGVSPVGWFDGVHVSPNGNINTINSPSPMGLYDMSGNASEWCHDLYNATYYGVSPTTNPVGPSSGTGRVVRGGQLNTAANQARSAKRASLQPAGLTGLFTGFRLARGSQE